MGTPRREFKRLAPLHPVLGGALARSRRLPWCGRADLVEARAEQRDAVGRARRRPHEGIGVDEYQAVGFYGREGLAHGPVRLEFVLARGRAGADDRVGVFLVDLFPRHLRGASVKVLEDVVGAADLERLAHEMVAGDRRERAIPDLEERADPRLAGIVAA